jgi:GGDEF domain-containing protein
MMDLDGLKRINDTHGHLFGAYSIQETGKLIARVLGERGEACRFGRRSGWSWRTPASRGTRFR